MRIEEIQAVSAAEQRVKTMKADAKAAKERARQMKARADASADQLDLKKARQKLAHLQRQSVVSTIKPYH